MVDDMTVDEATLREAQQTRDRLIELEFEADRARASYQHAIRRLHASGASLREIADALGLSHQRVHQIVEAVAGKVVFKEEAGGLHVCTFCGQPQNQVQKLIAGPGVFICDRCIALAHEAMANRESRRNEWAELSENVIDEKAKCDFCGQRTRKVDHMIIGLAFLSSTTKRRKFQRGPYARICNDCLDLCDRILAEPATQK